MAKKNDKIISRNIEVINQNGEELVRKYEQEKEKYVHFLTCSKNQSFWSDILSRRFTKLKWIRPTISKITQKQINSQSSQIYFRPGRNSLKEIAKRSILHLTTSPKRQILFGPSEARGQLSPIFSTTQSASYATLNTAIRFQSSREKSKRMSSQEQWSNSTDANSRGIGRS